MNIIRNFLFAVIFSRETIRQRLKMFFNIPNIPIFPKIFLYIYNIVFFIPFILILIIECIFLSIVFILGKFLSAFPLLGIIFSFIYVLIFICGSFLYYFINIIFTALPNFILADEKPLPYHKIATALFTY
jgi:hypothetical protein